jgi:hypothetical protein
MSAMLNRSMISALVLDYFRPDPLTAGRRRYYVVTLSDAHVVAMRTELRYSPQLVAAGAEGSEWVDVVFREKQVEVLNDLPPGPPDGDANGDGRIDLRDAAAFQRCMGATASLYPTCITAFDLDGSAGTDIGDWSAFSTAMLGP